MAKMRSAQTVYYGPSTSTYPAVGSVSSGETITVLWQEGSWYHIQYEVTGTNQHKRGYVPASTVSNAGTVSALSVLATDAGTRYVITDATTYTGPSSTEYPAAGSVSRPEAVRYLGLKPNNFAFIEYDISGSAQKKRAYIYANNLGVTAPEGGNDGDTGTGSMASYKTYSQYDTIPSSLPMGGATVTQGFNDKTTNHKGHLGYDLSGITYAKPLFSGTVMKVKTTNSGGNGRTVCIKHSVNGTTFYTTYCHLKSVSVSVGESVTTSTSLGVIGGSGYGSDSYYGTHVHVCAYTGDPTGDPYGYCASGGTQTFEQTTSYANKYYYGPDSSKFPRCGGVCFYDPYGVVTSNTAVITAHHP